PGRAGGGAGRGGPGGPRHRALLRLVYSPGMDKESCPAVVCCGGRMDFHGAPLSRTWVKLGATARKGATEVTLAEPVRGWRVGDPVIVTATQRDYRVPGPFPEGRTVAAVPATRFTLRRPRRYRPPA